MALLTGALGVSPAGADSTGVRCDIYPKGSDHTGKTIPRAFSQRQGFVTIRRDDGVVYDLEPVGNAPGSFRDQHGRLVYRQSELGSAGLIFRFDSGSVYVYWDTATVSPSPEDNLAAPFSSKD